MSPRAVRARGLELTGAEVPQRSGRRELARVLSACALAAACSERRADVGAPTFTRDVAPIVQRHCAVCHRPGQTGPFPLLSFEDVARRAKQVERVTRERIMPPWPPRRDVGGPFEGERVLSDEELATLRRWVENGAPEGDPADLPEPPAWPEGWQLGRPDLVLELEPAFVVPAEGKDIYRNFVLPIPVTETRWVRTLEFLPGNPRLLHHALMRVDVTGSARELDARDPAPGFAGMNMGMAALPDGHFLGWAPGKSPDPGRDDMAWRVEPGMELVLQMHLRPSGREESIQPSIGLYFAPGAPTKHLRALTLNSTRIDIPPGESDYTLEATFVLPVAVEVLSVLPHAHYLGKDLRAFALLPDGGTRWLLRIDPWDFDWQDQYRFVEPVPLPAGSTVVMHYSYDNSAENPANPSSPPRRVVFGESSTDEMGELLLEVLPSTPADRARLEQALAERVELGKLDYFRQLVERDPSDPRAQLSVGNSLVRLGRHAEAIPHYRELVRLRPRDVRAHLSLADALFQQGDVDAALAEYRAASALAPDQPEVQRKLEQALERARLRSQGSEQR